MILQGHYFGLQRYSCLAKKDYKVTILLFFSCYYPHVRFIYTIFTVFLQYLLSVTYFFVISHVLCYQSHFVIGRDTFLLSIHAKKR